LEPKLLIIGGSGLVGSTLMHYAFPKYKIHFTYNTNETTFDKIHSTQVNLLDNRSKIINLIKEFQPDIIVNTAAHSSVDLCEKNHKIADQLHVEVTRDITDVSKDIDSKLIYFSTDAVFPGELDKKYTELDQPNPINYYGKTKLQAEKIILNGSPDNVVLRTAVIYGSHKKSRFTNWILQTLKENSLVDPFIDQYNTPTLVDDLAKCLLRIFEKNISGLFHATGKSCLNRYEFALILADIFNLNKKLIKPVTSKEKNQDAPRPTSTCLDSSKLEKLIDFNFNDVQNGVSFIFKNRAYN
jgi:dTDP-4-dehydrorhamnose reductase